MSTELKDPTDADEVPAAPSGQSRGLDDKYRRIITLVLIALGVLALIYPVASTQFNNHKQIELAERYEKVLEDIAPEKQATALEAARTYNKTKHFEGPILDPWLARISPDNVDYNEYLSQLNIVDSMARLRIPAIKVDLPIYHGTAPRTLEHGVGHLFGSDLPVGGDGTHSVLTGHTGLATATLFDNLTDLKVGDAFYISVSGETLKYQVESTDVVLPDETDKLRVDHHKDMVTLVTCTPYGINTHRLLVHGVRVPMDEAGQAELDEAKGSVWQWWMIAILVGLAVTLLLVGWLLHRAWSSRGTHRGRHSASAQNFSTPGEGELA